MSRSLNRITLIGNLGKDPDFRTTPSGSSVCSFSLATTDSFKDRNGEIQETTDWHNIVMWEKLAEIAHQYLKKGSKIYLEGRIKYRSYEKEGITRYITDIIASNMIMLDNKSSSSRSSDSYEPPSAPPQSHKGYSNYENPLDSHLAQEDDDVPF